MRGLSNFFQIACYSYVIIMYVSRRQRNTNNLFVSSSFHSFISQLFHQEKLDNLIPIVKKDYMNYSKMTSRVEKVTIFINDNNFLKFKS